MKPEDIATTERRLDNWGRWAGSGTGGDRCASAERLYVPPREDENRVVATAREPINERDALLVEAAVLRVQRRDDRRFLVDWWVRRRPDAEMARRYRIPRDLFKANVTRLTGAVFYHLERLPVANPRPIEYRPMQQPDNSTTALGVQLALSRRTRG